jgi:hypothetical protein
LLVLGGDAVSDPLSLAGYGPYLGTATVLSFRVMAGARLSPAAARAKGAGLRTVGRYCVVGVAAAGDSHAPVAVHGCAPGYGGRLFAIDLYFGLVSMAPVMRAPFCVVNERRQQMAGLRQAHPRVRPERAVFQHVHVAAWGAPSVSDPLNRYDSVGSDLSPHPSPLPWGEGELLAVLGNVHRSVIHPKRYKAVPSPRERVRVRGNTAPDCIDTARVIAKLVFPHYAP